MKKPLVLLVIVGIATALSTGCGSAGQSDQNQTRAGRLVETEPDASSNTTRASETESDSVPGSDKPLPSRDSVSQPHTNGSPGTPVNTVQPRTGEQPVRVTSSASEIFQQPVVSVTREIPGNPDVIQRTDSAVATRELETQQKAFEELKAKQAQQERELEDTRRKLADEQEQRAREQQLREEQSRIAARQSAEAIRNQPAPYKGPTTGVITWEGRVRGTELITIENGQASSGTVTGSLPGVLVVVQPSDPKKVAIVSPPSPSNNYRRLVFRVTGNGQARVTLGWSLP